MTMTVGSLFSGCGGFDIGFKQAGFKTIWACEIDRQARAVFRRHFSDAELYYDITELDGSELAPVDVLIFGSPCQDLSVAGKRAGLAGARSGLFMEAMRIVDDIAPENRPRVAVWENVPGALSSRGGRDFGTVLGEMGKRWSGIAYRILDLQFFGPPQRRKRLFVVGHSGGWRSAGEILFEPEGMRWNPPPRREKGSNITSAITRSLGSSGADDNKAQVGLCGFIGQVVNTNQGSGGNRSWLGKDEPHQTMTRDGNPNVIVFGGNNTRGPVDVATACNAHGEPCWRMDFESETFVIKGAAIGRKPSAGPQYGDTLHDGTSFCLQTTEVHAVCHTLRGSGFDVSEDGTGRGTPVIPFKYNASAEWLPVDARGDICPTLQAESGHAVAFNLRGRDEGARLGMDDVASIRAASGGSSRSYVHHFCVRRLMPVECERLQGWPDGYTAWGIDDAGKRIELADGPRYRMIGNGVGVPVAKWIADRICEATL